MSQVVLHIGTHKTATTTIQDMFSHNAALLAKHGVIYPNFGKSTGHHGLVRDWNPKLPEIYALEQGSLGTLREIAATYGNGDHTVFLSSEEFSRQADGMRPDFTVIREALSGFDRIRVVCLLREQWTFVQSVYLEISRKKKPPSPAEILASVQRQDSAMGLATDYNQIYDHLLKSFDPADITFLDFEQCIKGQGGVLGAMLSYLGIDLTAEMLEPIHGGVSNPSPAPIPSWAANSIAAQAAAPAWLVAALTGAFGVQFGTQARSCIWTREEYRILQRYAARCNARLAARLAKWQPDFAISTSLLPMPDTPGAAVFRDDIPPEFWMRCSRWIFAEIRRGAAR